MPFRFIGIITAIIAVIIANALTGYFYPPSSLVLTPVVLTVISLLVVYGARSWKPVWKSTILFSFISIHDIVIKLFAGGDHDSIGQGLVHLSLFIGLIPAYILLFSGIGKDEEAGNRDKLFALLLFPLLMALHLFLFSKVGLSDYYR